MKRLGLALTTFVIWGSIASTYYVCIIRGLCVSSGENEVTSIKKLSPFSSIKKTIELNIPEKDAVLIDNTNNDTIPIVEKKSDTIPLNSNSLISLKEEGLKITYNDSVLKSYTSNFRIYKENNLVRIPLSLGDYGTVLKEVMLTNNAELTIIGYYNEFETNATGLARADQIRELLYAASFPKKHISIKAKKAIFNFTSYVFRGGIHFEFNPIETIISFEK